MRASTGSDESIGQRLKRLRLERGLSQRELASEGVSYAYISRIEAGTRQPSVKALRRLASKLGVPAEFLETGSELGHDEQRELRLTDAELALRLGDAASAESTLTEVLDDAFATGDAHSALRARVALASTAAERGDHRRAITLLEATLADGPPSPHERIDIYGELGRSYAATGQAEKAVELYEGCLDDVRALPESDPTTEIRYAVLLSYALSDIGELARAESIVKEALEHAREHEDDPYMRVRLYWSLARVSEMEGKSTAALHHVRRAIALLEATDDTIHLARAHVLCAWIMTSQGNAAAAQTQLEQAENLFGPHPAADDVAMLKVERARAAAALGDAEAAVTLSRDAISLLGDRDPAELGTAFWALGEGLAQQGETEASNEAFRRSVDLLSSQRRWREATQACQAWGKMLRRAGREEQALDVLERASGLGLNAAPATANAER